MFIVKNAGGTNAFTLKNISRDTGKSLAAGKSVIIICSETANGSTVIALD
jgi:superfamily II RNA helicase